jgi:hypothetical protein
VARTGTTADQIRERLEVHRMDTIILLQKIAETARVHPTVNLADAVSHLARAHALLTGELDLLTELLEPDEQKH